jgi:[acyl-carrier-protein] S-malonyltransferase
MMLALLCGGQGLLSAGMFDLPAERPEAAAIFAGARALLGRDPRSLVRDPSTPLLHANRISQILSVSSMLALHACIAAQLPSVFAVAGYSVGEMAAWSIAGAWSAETALWLTDQRARTMDAAGGDGGQLGYVRGLARPAVEALANSHGCNIAIIHPDRLFVVGGARADVAEFCREAEGAGATKAALLDVCVASHTPYLRDAVSALPSGARRPRRCRSDRRTPASGGRRRLPYLPHRARSPRPRSPGRSAHQLGGDAGGARRKRRRPRILDLGPGHALADMARAALPEVRSYAADGFHSVDGLRGWVAAADGRR